MKISKHQLKKLIEVTTSYKFSDEEVKAATDAMKGGTATPEEVLGALNVPNDEKSDDVLKDLDAQSDEIEQHPDGNFVKGKLAEGLIRIKILNEIIKNLST